MHVCLYANCESPARLAMFRRCTNKFTVVLVCAFFSLIRCHSHSCSFSFITILICFHSHLLSFVFVVICSPSLSFICNSLSFSFVVVLIRVICSHLVLFLIIHCHFHSFILICFRSHLLSFVYVLIRAHSLPFVVNQLQFIVTVRCHSLSSSFVPFLV